MARKEEKKKSLFLGITSRFLMTVAAGLLVVSYVSMFFNPVKAWFMTLFGLLFVPLWLLNAFLFVWAVFRRSKAAVIPLVVLIPSLLIVGRYYQLSKKEDEVQEEKVADAKIISYNVGRYRLSSKRTRIQDPSVCLDSVDSYLRRHNPDIVCLQEVQYPSDEAMKKDLSARFPGYDLEYFVFPTNDGCYGNVTLSRTRAIHKGKIDFEGTSNIAIYADYRIGERKFRVYNCHLQSYNISVSRLANVLMRRISGDDSTSNAVLRDTEQKMKSSILRRPRQVEAVLSDIENSPYEAIVAGDFNDTPMSYTYYRLKRGRKDSFVEAGKGFGATYALLRPFVRIDYVLVPESISVTSHDVGKVYFSDHFPVITTVSLENNPEQ